MLNNQITRAAEQAAAELRRDMPFDFSPPLDVNKLAIAMGVTDIRFRPMIGEGRLEFQDGTPQIVVQVRSRAPRQRFSIAHELGHLWLERQAQGGRLRLDRFEAERFCDAFAAELLLPSWWIHGRCRQRPSLSALTDAAAAAEASLAATFLRLRRGRRWRHWTLLHWRHRSSWNLDEMYGLSKSDRLNVASTEITHDALSALARERPNPVAGKLRLLVCGEARQFRAQLLVRQHSAVALALLKATAVQTDALSQRKSVQEERPAVHTLRTEGRWTTYVGGRGSLQDSHMTRSLAIDFARDVASSLSLEHIIHGFDGVVTDRRTYPDD